MSLTEIDTKKKRGGGGGGGGDSDSEGARMRERIIRRAALEFRDGMPIFSS